MIRMLGRILMVSMVASLLVTDAVSQVSGETVPPHEIDWNKRVEFGRAGNITYYLNDDGSPKEIYVVGVAAISPTLNSVEAQEEASEEAELNAKAAFAYWLKENMTFRNSRDKKTLVVRTGTTVGEKVIHKEQGETTIISKSEAERMATAMWRGVTAFWYKCENGKYAAVWKWSVESQKAAQAIQNFMKTEVQQEKKTHKQQNSQNSQIKGQFRQGKSK